MRRLWPGHGEVRPSPSPSRCGPDRSRTLTPPPASLINRRRTSPSTGIPLELVGRDDGVRVEHQIGFSMRSRRGRRAPWRSVASEPPRQLDVEGVEVDVADALEELGGSGVDQGLGQTVSPSLVFVLQGPELG